MTPPQPQVSTWWVTPTLFLGRAPAGIAGIRLVTTAEQAVAAIIDGFTAVLPAGAWPEAENVLRAMGLSPREIQDRIRFAQTGRTTLS